MCGFLKNIFCTTDQKHVIISFRSFNRVNCTASVSLNA